MAQDTILIKNLRIDAFVGIYDFEQENLQPLVFDIKITSATGFFALEGDLRKSVDYAQVAALVQEFVQAKKHLLLETLAEEVAQFLLANFSMKKLKLKILKPKALKNALVGVKISRKNSVKNSKKITSKLDNNRIANDHSSS